MSEPRRVSLEHVERDAYDSTDQIRPFSEATAQLQAIGETLYPAAEHHWELDRFASQVVWELGDDALRHKLAIGSMATRAWPRRAPVSPLYFRHDEEFIVAVHATDHAVVATSSLIAVARSYRSLAGYIPNAIAPWAARIGRIGDGQDQLRIATALQGLRFSDSHIDSEDMHNAHPVAQYLFDNSLSAAFRQMLLNLAVADVDTTAYKPWAWRSQLNVTLKRVASDAENPLRFTARKQLSLPESDDTYALLLEQEAAKVAQKRSEQISQIATKQAAREARLQTAKEHIRSAITQVLQ